MIPTSTLSPTPGERVATGVSAQQLGNDGFDVNHGGVEEVDGG
jgi:hypothetical protein